MTDDFDELTPHDDGLPAGGAEGHGMTQGRILALYTVCHRLMLNVAILHGEENAVAVLEEEHEMSIRSIRSMLIDGDNAVAEDIYSHAEQAIDRMFSSLIQMAKSD